MTAQKNSRTSKNGREADSAIDPVAPAAMTNRSQTTIIWAGVVISLAVVVCFFPVIDALVRRWAKDPDYSHGFLVPLISLYLLWFRRGMIHAQPQPQGNVWMAALAFLAAAAIRAAAIVLQYPLLEPVAILPCFAGVAFLLGGWSYAFWSWPSIAFLAFAIPLPGAIANRLAGPLQRIATEGSTYILQTVGISAAASGNVILLSTGEIGVVEACNGLRMLVAFLAIAFAITVILRIPVWERGFLLFSGIAVALICNVIRIAATGVVYEKISPALAERLFHDLAGLFMMPLATGILALEILVLGRVFPLANVDTMPLLVERQRGANASLPPNAVVKGRASHS
jgi:exosortase